MGPTSGEPAFASEELAVEVWRVVPGYASYEASNLGRVRSWRTGRVRLLTPTLFRNGYWYVSLTADGAKRHKCRQVHTVVLESFVGARPAGMQGRHFPDPNTANNRLANLSWATPAANAADKPVHGEMRRQQGDLA